MSKTRVFLIDDHGVLRQGLRMLIESQDDMCVTGESERGGGAAGAITLAGADVVVLDISLPDMTGRTVATEVRQALPSVKIVTLTRYAEKAYVQQMLSSGASGYVLKQTAGDALLSAIRTVAAGGTFIDPAVKSGKTFGSGASLPLRSAADLTPREREVLTMVAWGHSNKEIASVLGITVKTVETHKAKAMQKLEIGSWAELVRFAMTERWLEHR